MRNARPSTSTSASVAVTTHGDCVGWPDDNSLEVARSSRSGSAGRSCLATYAEIQFFVKTEYGFVPKTCWIAHVKELCGLSPRMAPNRASQRKRAVPCPPNKTRPIQQALVHFGLVGALASV